jgi:preprotein translocase subunit SecA
VGLFDWLFGKAAPERVAVADRIWLNAEGRAGAVVRELSARLKAGCPVLLLAHFAGTLESLAPALVAEGLPREPIPDGLTPEAALRLASAGPPRVLFGLVGNLKLPESPAPDDAPDSPLPVVLAERHFLRDRDDRVARFADGLGGRAAVTVHLSLEDELMRRFAGEWMADVLKRLGMKEGEAIDSPMVARRVRQAQDKLRGAVRAEEKPADSPAEWLRLNRRD